MITSNNDMVGNSTAADTPANTDRRMSVAELPTNMILKKKKKGKSKGKNKVSANER